MYFVKGKLAKFPSFLGVRDELPEDGLDLPGRGLHVLHGQVLEKGGQE